MSTQNGGWVIILNIKPFLNFIKSLRFRGFLAVFLSAVLPVVIFVLVIASSYDKNAYENRVAVIREYGNTIRTNLGALGLVSFDTLADFESEISYFANMYEGRAVVVDKNLRVIFDTYGLGKGKTLISEEAINSFKGTESLHRNRKKNYVEFTMPILNPQDKAVIGIMVLSFSLKDMKLIADKLVQSGITLITILIVLMIIFAALYADMLSKPMRRLSREIDRLSNGNMDGEVAVRGYTELENISSSFNKMLSRAKKLEGSRQEFVSNVSHELKTPMASMKVLADALLEQPDADIEMYKEFMIDINNEIERENKIINDLLSLVRLDKKTGVMNTSLVDLNELLEQILKRLGPIAKKKNVELVFESFRAVKAEVDEVKISLALSNLIENAIKYNVEDGFVRVSLNADHKFFFVKVSDSGIGIPEEYQDQIFERFYRVDKARSRGTGGTGLGLSITKNVILMHHGEIRLYSKEDEGTTFTVRIPLSFIPPKNQIGKKKDGKFKFVRQA